MPLRDLYTLVNPTSEPPCRQVVSDSLITYVIQTSLM